MSAAFAEAKALLKVIVTVMETSLTNVVCAEEQGSQRATVTATETYWMSAVYAEERASLMGTATAKETYWTSAAFAAVTALQKALVIAMALCLPMATIAPAFA